jgi:hypothetical protein
MPRLLSGSARIAPVELSPAALLPVELSATALLHEQNRALNEKVARLTEENAALTAELRVARELVTELSAGVGIFNGGRNTAEVEEETGGLLCENVYLKQQNENLSENSRRQAGRIQTLTLKVSELKQTVGELEYELEKGSRAVLRYTQSLRLTNDRLSTLEAMFTDIKEQLTCPITQNLFEDPCISVDGNTFELSAIRTWIQSSGTCPLSRMPLEPRMLFPNRLAKNVIEIIMRFRWA